MCDDCFSDLDLSKFKPPPILAAWMSKYMNSSNNSIYSDGNVTDKNKFIPERHSVKVLRDCIELQNKKGADYQSSKSSIKQADYYPSGCLTILEIMHAKMLRMRSVIEASMNDPEHKINYESLDDSARDLINYASFLCSYAAGKMDGQDLNNDFLNRKMIT